MAEIEFVIFDCDGVLMDSEIVAAAAETETYKEYGVEMTPNEFAERFAGLNSSAIIKKLEEELGRSLPERVLEDVRARVNEKILAEAQMIEDADTVLDRFDQPRCICSNSPPDRLKAMLGRVGLYDRFRPYVFSAEDVDPPIFKPLPDLFLKALKEFGMDARKTVVIEDSVHGIHGARAAGCRVIGFTGASHTYPNHADQLIDAGAETVISRMKDLPAVIDAFSNWDGME